MLKQSRHHIVLVRFGNFAAIELAFAYVFVLPEVVDVESLHRDRPHCRDGKAGKTRSCKMKNHLLAVLAFSGAVLLSHASAVGQDNGAQASATSQSSQSAVDQDVELLEFIGKRRRILNRLRSSKVELNEANVEIVLLEPGSSFPAKIGVSCPEQNRATSLPQLARYLKSNASVCACDQCDFV